MRSSAMPSPTMIRYFIMCFDPRFLWIGIVKKRRPLRRTADKAAFRFYSLAFFRSRVFSYAAITASNTTPRMPPSSRVRTLNGRAAGRTDTVFETTGVLVRFKHHLRRAEHHLRGILHRRCARQSARHAAVGHRLEKHGGKGRTAARHRRACVLQFLFEREEPPAGCI